MNDDEKREAQRETDGGMFLMTIAIVSMISALVGCGVTWALMTVFGR